MNLGCQLVVLIQINNLVAAADADAIDQHVGHGATASLFRQQVLQRAADGMLVEFDYEGLGLDGVFVEEDTLCALRVGAVALGKDDHYKISFTLNSLSVV